MIIKTIALMLLYLVPLLSLMLFSFPEWCVIILYLVMGLATAGIGMSVMHDANHGAYSRNKNMNTFLGNTINLLGGMSFTWKLQHNVLHHTYTNVHGWDDDIENKSLLRFSPHNPPKKFHRFQFIYVFLFYSILSLYWCTFKDFVQYFKYRKNGVSHAAKKQNLKNFVSMIILKLFYFTILLVLPMTLEHYSAILILLSFLLMHAVAGIILGVIFQMAHSVEETSFPLPKNNIIENDWAIHQMNTTFNFGRNNKILSWYVGGLNFQVEHHLFPHICHIHYSKISKIVEATSKEFNIPYLCAPSFSNAFGSHVRQLKKFGYGFNLDVATM